MPIKDQANSNDKSLLRYTVTRPEEQQVEAQDQLIVPGRAVQTARISPQLLTRQEALQLQQTVGNQAVGRLLAQNTLQLKNISSQTVQRTIWEWTGVYWQAVRTEGDPTRQPDAPGSIPGERISTGRETELWKEPRKGETQTPAPPDTELVWEEYTGSGPLFRWTSTEGAKDAKTNGIQMSGTEQDGIPTLSEYTRGAALGSGAVSTDYLLRITVSKIPNFRARYSGTRNGPKEIKVMVSIPPDAIEKIKGSHVK